MDFNIVDLDLAELAAPTCDVIITSSGYEARSRFLSKKLLKAKCLPKHKYVLTFSDFTNVPEREKNDFFFRRQGFTFVENYAGKYGEIAKLFKDIFVRYPDCRRILIDYTTMRRDMYAEVLQVIGYDLVPKDIEWIFGYSVGKPSHVIVPKTVDDYVMLPGLEGLAGSKREKVAIYNLGFEPIILQSIHEWLEPTRCVGFYAEPGISLGSGRFCLEKNKRFIDNNNVEPVPLSLYSVSNYCTVFREIAKEIFRDFDLIICSAGPKPFTLGAMLCSNGKILASHIYARGSEALPIGPQPNGELIITSVVVE